MRNTIQTYIEVDRETYNRMRALATTQGKTLGKWLAEVALTAYDKQRTNDRNVVHRDVK